MLVTCNRNATEREGPQRPKRVGDIRDLDKANRDDPQISPRHIVAKSREGSHAGSTRFHQSFIKGGYLYTDSVCHWLNIP
jgi:hypothetical protein